VALQRKGVKPIGFAEARESVRKCGNWRKNSLPEGACGGETLYMSRRMQIYQKTPTANRRSVLLQAPP